MNPALRKLAYMSEIVPIIKGVKNWYDVLGIFLKPETPVTLNLRSGERIKICHYLEALVVKEVFVSGDYDLDLKDIKTVIDIGANIGTFTVYAAKKFPNAKIYSFEPGSTAHKLLTDNLELNNITSVVPHKMAVAAKPGTIDLYTMPATGLSGMFRSEGATNKETVPAITLQGIFDKYNIETCDLLKIDCEGAEYEIFYTAAPETLKRITSIAMEWHDWVPNHNHKTLAAHLEKNGFRVVVKKHPFEDVIGMMYAYRK